MGGGGAGGKGGTGGSGGSSGTGGCQTSACPLLATMGLNGLQPSSGFNTWLSEHSSSCLAQNLSVTGPCGQRNLITAELLAPYQVIIVMDVDHLPQDYTNFWALQSTNIFEATLGFINPPTATCPFSAAEAQALLQWVQNGGGLFVINGFGDALSIIYNFNTLVEPLGLVYYSPDCSPICGISGSCSCSQQPQWTQDAYGVYTLTTFAASPITLGVTNLYISGYWPISGYPTSPTGLSFPTALGSNYQVLATSGCSNCKVAKPPLNIMAAGTVGRGRVIAYGDEWITFDQNWADPTYGSSVSALWNNAIKWLGNCP